MTLLRIQKYWVEVTLNYKVEVTRVDFIKILIKTSMYKIKYIKKKKKK